jgi:hypothetical protein
LIQVNNMPRFVGTPSFNLCALVLGRPQFKIKTSSGLASAAVVASNSGGRGRIPPSSDSPKAGIPVAFGGSDDEAPSRGGTPNHASRGLPSTVGGGVRQRGNTGAAGGSDDEREHSGGATPLSGVRGIVHQGSNGSPHNLEKRPLLASASTQAAPPDLCSPTSVRPSSMATTPVVIMNTLADRNNMNGGSSPLPPGSSHGRSITAVGGVPEVAVHIR